MELNVINTTLGTKRELLSKNYEQPIEMNMILPEYYPEIEKILSCKGEAYISSKAVEGNSLVLNGTVNVTLIYNDSEEKMNAYHASVPFNKKIELSLSEMSFVASAKAMISYFNYKATSPKKVDVRGALNIPVEIWVNDNYKVIEKIEDNLMETKQDVVKSNRFFGNTEQNVFIEEELAIENDRAAVKCILKVVKDCRVESCKIINNKVIVKGILDCKIIYCSTENQIEQISVEIPFNQIMDFDGLDESCSCFADTRLCSFDIETKTNYEGEVRTLIFTATACIALEAYRNNETSYLSDAYATKYETELETQEIALLSLMDEHEERFVCKKDIEYPEQIIRIENCWGEVLNSNLQIESGKMFVSGNILVCAVICDANEQYRFLERTIDYEWEKACDDPENNLLLKCKVKLPALTCNISADGIEIIAELKMVCRAFKEEGIKCINKVNLLEDKPIKNPDSIGAVLYFAKSGDRIWDIAKEHNTAKELIKEYNNVDSDIIKEDTALLLPLV